MMASSVTVEVALAFENAKALALTYPVVGVRQSIDLSENDSAPCSKFRTGISRLPLG
jgi:hypothetical protein